MALAALGALSLGANPNWPPPNNPSVDLSLSQNWPDDPSYGGQWQLWSFVPKQVSTHPGFRQAEVAMGAGMHADRAWQLATGRFDVTIAVLDSGFLWNERDLVNKWRLNRGELPPPQDASGAVSTGADPWDRNGDGVFNVQDYTTATGHGQPLKATALDPRLTSRPDGGDVNGNGIIDPQDLIAIFQDGKDNDGNGYVDDICGWDFLWDDNDPFDDVGNGGQGYSHGTGESLDSAAETNNGLGGAGTCPGCSVLPLRVSDSFVADANAFARAVLYATDNGASVVQEALGSLNNTPFMQGAIDYAYTRGVGIIASAADETSFHHNYPGNAEHTMYVHAILYDGKDWNAADTTTFLNYNNCTNWGGHLYLSTPGVGCSSEATGLTGGHAGLVYSAAKDKGLTPPLSAAEMYQLLTMAADDINVPESASDPTKYPSGPGWDAHFGYGRNNMRGSVEMVAQGKIPPEVDVSSPRWFETIDPGLSHWFETSPGPRPIVQIEGEVAARRAPSYDFTVEVAPGLEARDESFVRVGGGSGLSAPVSGPLAQLDVTTLFPDVTRPPNDPHEFAVSLRVRAVAHYGGAVGDVPGEFRKTFFVHSDPNLFAGYPKYVGASGESPPHLADLDGDGKDEIVVGLADGTVHAFKASGDEAPGFPVRVSPLPGVTQHLNAPAFKTGAINGSSVSGAILGAVAVGDITGDGKPEVVAVTMEGEVWAWDNQGVALPGFPKPQAQENTLPCFAQLHTGCSPAGLLYKSEDPGKVYYELRELSPGYFAAPVLVDLDGDGVRDILAAGLDGHLHAYRGNGSMVPGYPLLVMDPQGGATGDMTDGTNRVIWTYARTRLIGTPAVGDVDGDGRAEILTGTNEVFERGTGGRGYLLRSTGASTPTATAEALMPSWPVHLQGLSSEFLPFLGRGVPSSPVMGDLDGDGIPELSILTLAAPGEFYNIAGHKFMTTNNSDFGDKANSSDAPILIAINSGTLADIDGDGKLDYANGTVGFGLVAGASGGKRAPFDHTLSAWSAGVAYRNKKAFLEANPGQTVEAPFLRGFPHVVEDYQFLMNYAVADLDGDGRPEVIGGTGGYNLNAFNADGVQPGGWPKFTGGWIISSAAVGDLDGDGFLDIVAITREGWLWAWRTTGHADQAIGWEGFHHDAMNTGNASTPLEHRNGPLKCQGCCCASVGQDSAPLLLGMSALGLFVFRRRKTQA